jgi:RNA polymerase sigma factor (sigma-70 family)
MIRMERPSLEKQVSVYQPRLKAFIRRRVTNKEDAEDILQDVLFQWMKALENTLNPIEQVAAWLYRVARNTIINHGAKKREEALPVYAAGESEEEILLGFSSLLCAEEEGSASPETDYLRSLVWMELEAALAELPAEQREVFELTELDGIPVKEIALATGTAVATLLSRKHYAVLHLRKRLKDLYADFTA